MPLPSTAGAAPAAASAPSSPLSLRPVAPAMHLAEVDLAQSEGGPPLPKVEAAPPFFYAWHPARYTVVEGRVLPFLRTVPLQAGVNNVTLNKDGKLVTSRMKSHLEERGWTILPWKRGPAGKSYMQQLQTRTAGGEIQTSFLSVFESAYPGSAEITADTASYAAWLEQLVADGTIPACPSHIAEQLCDQLRTRYLSMSELISRGDTRYRYHADQLAVQLESVERYLADVRQPIPAAAAAVDIDEED